MEAQHVAHTVERSGVAPQGVVWEFLISQWPIVTQEAGRHFNSAVITKALLRDVPAMEAGVRAFAPALYPLTAQTFVEEVVQRLYEAGEEEGWVLV